MTIEKYHKWKDENGRAFIPVSLTGMDLLRNTILSKGTAFSRRERAKFRLEGLLPPRITTLDEQIERAYGGYCRVQSDIDRYCYLRALQDRKEILFYALVSRYIEEMTPIIYTPTVGEACMQFSHRFQNTRGLYITSENVNHMSDMIHHLPSRDIKIIVMTDGQGILGIGDQGVGGMGIPIGKLSLYVLGAGIHPASCLPITLDVGTDNKGKLKDDLYLGLRERRMDGKQYADFIAAVVANIRVSFPGAILQWEDFSKENAFENMLGYQNALPSFNDDVQGTGAVALAGILNAMKIKGEELREQHFAVYGAGAGGGGICYQIKSALTEDGLSEQEALDRIFLFDSKGLVLNNRRSIEAYKAVFSKDNALVADWERKETDRVTLEELIDNHRVTVLIGASTQTGAFDDRIVKGMLLHTERPVIFPLSNPTSKCEATPEALFRTSGGRAIVATGSPFDDVAFGGARHRIGQGNNVFIFPGVGLSAIVGGFRTLPPAVLTTAATALAEYTGADDLSAGSVFPRIGELRDISVHVAARILDKHWIDRPQDLSSMERLEAHIRAAMWRPEYLPYRRV